MPQIVQTRLVDRRELGQLREPRADIVVETPDGPDDFSAVAGPFDRYRRSISTVSEQPGGLTEVTESFDYHVPVGPWKVLLGWPIRRALRAGHRVGEPWWAPPDRLDAGTAHLLASLCTLSILDGYLGTVITQTMTFAADEFGTSDTGQGWVLASVRIGVILSVVVMAIADRRGRRTVLGWCAASAALLTLAGAFAPEMIALGVSQAAARGFTTAFGMLLIVIASEELPPRSRAYGLSVIILSAALGAGMAVWVLPVADIDIRSWRILYVLPALFLPLLRPVWRNIPETKRFADVEHFEEAKRIEPRRFVLLATIGFLLAAFAAPASQFQNEFLKDDRGFNAATITLFTLVTATPAGIGVFIGGVMADRRGRRVVAAIGAAGGAILMALAYGSSGSMLWTLTLLGTVVGALVIPSLGVYGPEMFGTGVRASANGYIRLVTVAGSALGLILVGWLSDELGGFGQAFTVMSIAPILVAVIVLAFLPETVGRTLEELNPPDAA